MIRRTLGQTGKILPAVGLGTWAIGGTDWGPADDAESEGAIHAALELGVTLIDTADFYGFGHAEEVLGRALAGRRDEAFIATKGGLRWDGAGEDVRRDSSPAYLRQAVEASLRRLRTDRIDLYQIHWPDETVPIEDSLSCLHALRAEGKILHVGVSNYDPAQTARAAAVGPLASHQLPLSLIDRRAEADLLPWCEAHKVGVLAYSPLGMGLLTGKYVAEQVFDEGDVRGWFPMFRGEGFRRHLALVDALRPIAQAEACTLAQLAVRWVIDHPAVTCALVGARRREQVAEAVGGATSPLSDRARSRIAALLEA